MKAEIRRRWLGITMFLAVILVITGCSSSTNEETGGDNNADAGGSYSYDFSHMFPPNHVMETKVVQTFIDKADKATDGQVQVTSYPGSQLAEPDGQYEAAATGVVDMAFSVHSYTPGQFPLTSVMEMPFLAESANEGAEVLLKLYDEFPEIQEEHADTEVLWLGTTEPGQIFTAGKPVKSIEDLKGMRIRSPSPEVNKWLKEMGATPVSMPLTEAYEAIQKGVVDGTVGPYHTLLDQSLVDVIDYVTVGDFYMSTFFSVMNKDSWESIDEDTKASLSEIKGEEMTMYLADVMDTRKEEAIEASEEQGIEFYQLSDKELEEWRANMQPAIDEWIQDKEDKGLPGKEIYERAVEIASQE
ncbi:TRAP transporter substrate-binding protein [Bacillus piscicola]|uniref:TRAP transporter substrate-binding protein n=1 Tax=Bacillus piscicola TaxID=1632684 RepID=UPI001F09018F|nr:TRAP transporter substrate-binding protein [Bacillus piscicola]